MAVVPAILILSAFVAPASPRRCDFPPRLATFLHAAADIRPGKHSARWEVAADTRQRILHKYFGVAVDEDTAVELFSIDNVPAAALCWRATNAHGQPLVSAVHVNKGLVILFDAGKTMRYMLWQRYPQLSFANDTQGVDAFFAV